MTPTIYEYFQRACNRRRGPIRGMAGQASVDADGASAVFWLESDGDTICAAEYRCTTCCTLTALCERLAELLPGCTLDEAAGWTAERLLALHPEIPPVRRGRARLAVSAVRSALEKAREGACI